MKQKCLLVIFIFPSLKNKKHDFIDLIDLRVVLKNCEFLFGWQSYWIFLGAVWPLLTSFFWRFFAAGKGIIW